MAVSRPPLEPPRHGPRRSARSLDWDTLFRARTVEEARGLLEREGGASTSGGEEEFSAWVAEGIDAWRAARGRSSGLGRDVEAIQGLGHRMAEARSEGELFESAADAIHARHGLDAAGLRIRSRGSDEGRILLFRPWSEEALEEFTRLAEGETPEGGRTRPPRWVVHRRPSGEGFPPRGAVADAEVLVFPLGTRAGVASSLSITLAGEVDEHAIRFTRAVSNLVALHLDRMAAIEIEEDLRFRAILDAMPQAVWLVDPGLRVVRRNRAGEVLAQSLGWAEDAEVGSLGDLDLGAAARVVLSGKPAASSLHARLPDGRIASVTVAPVSGSGGRPDAAVLVVEDVTRARRMQAQLAQADRLASLGRMLSGVAHELNNPLATVVGFAQLARSLPSGPALDKRLGLVHEEALRCQRIVGNLLRFARRHDPERKAVALNEIVDATLGLFQYQLRVDGIRVERDLDRGIPAVPADPHEIQQALVNLLGNAHHAVRGAGRGGTIALRTYPVGTDRVAIEIRDDGPGIPEAIRDRLFDPFFTTKEPGKGTGLGLSLVFGTVASHGGTIEVESREGHGATFRIVLPIAVPEPNPVAEPSSDPDPPPERSARVLVVDDEPAVALLICETLAQDGHRPIAAHDAEEALRRLREEEWDVVVFDLKMPGLGAEQLYEVVVRERPGLAQRLVLTTGDTVTLEPEALARRAGIPLVHKPFALEALRAAVRTGLRRTGSA